MNFAAKLALIVACMLSGALMTVTLKALFDTTVVLADGSAATFRCPFFAALLQFLARSMMVMLQTLAKCMPSASEDDTSEVFSTWDIGRYVIGQDNLGLSAFYTSYVLLSQTALLFVPASTHAALQQATIPMVVALRFWMFEKAVAQHQMIGIGIFTLGLVVIAVASQTAYVNLSGGVFHYWCGIFLLGAASLLLAGRYVAEETLIQNEKKPPMVVVGAQGFIGSILSAGVLVFAHYLGYEDFWSTVGMLRSSSQLQVLVVMFAVLTCVYNSTLAYILQQFDSTCTAMVRGTKPLWVWSLQLLCFYVLVSSTPTNHYGEAWAPPASWFVLFAVIMVSIGLGLYFHEGVTPSNNEMACERDALRKHAKHALPVCSA
jgi:hypothetical protein